VWGGDCYESLIDYILLEGDTTIYSYCKLYVAVSGTLECIHVVTDLWILITPLVSSNSSCCS